MGKRWFSGSEKSGRGSAEQGRSGSESGKKKPNRLECLKGDRRCLKETWP